MKKFLKWFYIIMILLQLGCAQNKVVSHIRETKESYTQQKTLYFFLWGFFPRMKYTFRDLCGDDYLRDVSTYSTFPDWPISYFTLGIVFPRTMEYTCVKEKK